MERLEKFISYLCGSFNNEEQLQKEAAQGRSGLPKAKHINGVCNEKIKNLPDDFKGYFVIEESYYEVAGRTNVMPHLFLFTLNSEGKVMLTSYELPEGVAKEDFTNENGELCMDYEQLKKSEKFTPMVYQQEEDSFKGESISDFGHGLVFTLQEKTSSEGLEVKETFERNGQKTFGFDEPLCYKRI